jgi:hypothetical protein
MVANLKLNIIEVLGEFIFLFGLIAWIYGVLVQFTHPEWLNLGLSHLVPWIRVDTFTIVSFIFAALGFLIWRLSKALKNTS